MDAFAQLFLGGFILDAVMESFKLIGKMIKERTPRWENIGTFFFGWLITSVTHFNIFTVFGIEGEGNLFYNVSYLTFAIIGMRGSAAIHDLYRAIKNG